MKTVKLVCILFILCLAPGMVLYSVEKPDESEIYEHQVTKNTKLSANEVYLGYGYPSSISPILTYGLQSLFLTIFSGGTQNSKLQGFGVAQAGYNWYCIPGQGLAIGGLITVEPYITKYESTSNPENFNTDNIIMTTIQATVKYQYGWKYIRLYHGISAGLGISTTINDGSAVSTCIFIFDVIPIGIKVGKEKGFNFFADMGIGATPVINAGASYRF